MTTCTICDYHYSSARAHCPTCGTLSDTLATTPVNYNEGKHNYLPIVVAHGAERARQMFIKSFQTPRAFQTVD